MKWFKAIAVPLLVALFFMMGVSVVQAEVDSTPPVVHYFDVTPAEIDTTSGPQTVTITAHVTDEQSGASSLRVTFMGPPGGPEGGPEIPIGLDSGTPNDGIWIGYAAFDQYSEPGEWYLAGYYTTDYIGNMRTGDASEFSPEHNIYLNVNVTVQTPEEAIEELIGDVDELDLPPFRKALLKAELNLALRFLDKGRIPAAKASLLTFIVHVRNLQRQGFLSGQIADELVSSAREIIGSI